MDPSSQFRRQTRHCHHHSTKKNIMRVVVAISLLLAVAAPATALRGDSKYHRQHRRLQVGDEPAGAIKDPLDEGLPPPPPLPEQAGEESKKSKNECKKAKDHAKKKGDDGRRTYNRKQRGRRNLQQDPAPKNAVGGVAPPPPIPTLEEEFPYCLHAQLTPEQCANLSELPKDKDGRVQSELRMELVHDDTKDSDDILREVEEILGTDTQSRFVGCQDMKHPVPPPKMRSRYALEAEPVFEDDSDNVDVIGVTFTALQVSRGDCKKEGIPAGLKCDVVKSNVDIFYKSVSDPSTENLADMKNLLVETITSQAIAGSFTTVGAIKDISLDEGSNQQTDEEDIESSSTTRDVDEELEDEEMMGMVEEDNKAGFAPYVGGIAALLIVFGFAYWYGTKDNKDEEEGKVYATSDSDPDTE